MRRLYSLQTKSGQVNEGLRMRQARREVLRRSGGLALGGALLGQVLRPGVATAEGGEAGIVGSWMVFVAYDGSGGQRTRGLATFTPGGCFVGSISAFEGMPTRPTPSRGTTLHGSWKHTGNDQFALTAVRLHVDAQGSLLGVMTTHISIEVGESGATWSGTFVFTAADPDGHALRSDRGRLNATRISV